MGKGRAPCCEKGKVKRGPWSPAEDLKLITFIQKNGHDNWRSLPKQSGLVRCGKSCRLRWINYLRPDVKRGNFTKEEEENIIKLHETLGNKWSKIASHFPGRTDNEIKNVWNTHLKKKLAKISNPSANESNESSIVTSSSSSSTNSILSGRKRDSEEAILEEEESDPKSPRCKSICCKKNMDNNKEDVGENDNTTKEGEYNDGVFSTLVEKSPKQQPVLSTTTSSNSLYDSNGSSTHIGHQASKLGDPEDDILIDDLLLDFEGSFDVDAILQEVNQPDQEVMPLLLEDNYDDSFWDMFGPNSTTLGSALFDTKSQEVQVLATNDPRESSCLNSVFGEEKGDDIANNKEWFRYLESELGLETPMVDISGQKEQALDQNYHAMAIEEVGEEYNFFDLEPKPEFSPSAYDLWPSN